MLWPAEALDVGLETPALRSRTSCPERGAGRGAPGRAAIERPLTVRGASAMTLRRAAVAEPLLQVLRRAYRSVGWGLVGAVVAVPVPATCAVKRARGIRPGGRRPRVGCTRCRKGTSAAPVAFSPRAWDTPEFATLAVVPALTT